MSNWKNWIFKEESAAPMDSKAARKRAVLLASPFAFLGIAALVMLVHDLHGGLPKQKAITTLSFVAVCFGLVALIFGISAKKHALKTVAAKSEDEKPWLKRKDWADGRIASSSRHAILLFWIFVVFWNLVSAVITLVVLSQTLRSGNHAALIALIFPAVGIVVLIFAANTTLAWRKFGQSIFEMAAVPAALGGTLEGEIQVKTRLQPQHGLHLRLSCVRRATAGASNNRQTSEKILWQDEKWLRADLPQTDLNATGIPVFFKLPDNMPESTPSLGDGIHWKLEASAKLRGPNFHAAFEVPVFKLPGPPEIFDDPTAQYQMSLDDVRKQIRSKIQVNDLADGGREFIFPAARNPGFATGASVFCLIWTGIVALLVWKHAPFLFPLVFGVMDLLMAAFVFDLWFRRSRVVVGSESVTIQKAWLAFKKEQRFQAGEIKDITSEIGATAGHAAYHDLKIRTRAGRQITAASNLASKPEADWLVRQMSAALKNVPPMDSNS
jgi:FtsH-binding integral membrane protein